VADSITPERLREIASSDPLVLAICAKLGEPSWADVRAIAAELLAARARIAKLEQQPPMKLVDFGVGFNWAGLREDMQRLRAERDAARAQLHADDQLAWQTLGKPEGTYSTTNVQRLCDEVERLRLAIRFGGCSAVHAASLSEAGGEWAVKAVQDVDGLRAEVERLQEQVQCRGCGGTVGDHLAPDQGGCPGRFVIDGVEMVPAKHKEPQ
jgi:hypothetical protein